MNLEERNREIDESMSIGARAFAVGATLILVLALTGVPGAHPDDMMTRSDVPATIAADASTVASGATDGASTDVAMPFNARQVGASALSP